MTATPLKTIILRETKNWKTNKYFISLGLDLGFFSFMIYITILQIPEIIGLQEMIAKFMFSLLPSFGMWVLMMPMIVEKFNNEKLTKLFEVMLTAPISLNTIWLGKLISLFLLNYIAALLITLIAIFMWIMVGLNPIAFLPCIIWILGLIILPMYLMIYVAFSAWSILRFSQPKTYEILNLLGILAFILAFLGSDKIIKIIFNGDTINRFVVVTLTLGIVILFSILYMMVSKLNKEKITV